MHCLVGRAEACPSGHELLWQCPGVLLDDPKGAVPQVLRPAAVSVYTTGPELRGTPAPLGVPTCHLYADELEQLAVRAGLTEVAVRNEDGGQLLTALLSWPCQSSAADASRGILRRHTTSESSRRRPLLRRLRGSVIHRKKLGGAWGAFLGFTTVGTRLGFAPTRVPPVRVQSVRGADRPDENGSRGEHGATREPHPTRAAGGHWRCSAAPSTWSSWTRRS